MPRLPPSAQVASSVVSPVSAPTTLSFTLPDAPAPGAAAALNAGFNQVAVCVATGGGATTDATSPAANCDLSTVLYVGAPVAQLAVYGPAELGGPLFAHKFVQAGQPLLFVWNSTAAATPVDLLMWMTSASASALSLDAASLVT